MDETVLSDYLIGKEEIKMELKSFHNKMVDYLKKALIYGHTSRISS